jgi:hypothetical protein
MDDIGGDDMGSGIHELKLRFFCLFFGFEIGSQDLLGASDGI